MTYRTYTYVVRLPDGLSQDEADFYADDARSLLTDEAVMFWAMEPGITPVALDLGADPEAWPDQKEN